MGSFQDTAAKLGGQCHHKALPATLNNLLPNFLPVSLHVPLFHSSPAASVAHPSQSTWLSFAPSHPTLDQLTHSDLCSLQIGSHSHTVHILGTVLPTMGHQPPPPMLRIPDLHLQGSRQRYGTGSVPGGSDDKSVCLQHGRPRFDPWVRKIPWRRKWQPAPVFLPGKFHGWRSLV